MDPKFAGLRLVEVWCVQSYCSYDARRSTYIGMMREAPHKETAGCRCAGRDQLR